MSSDEQTVIAAQIGDLKALVERSQERTDRNFERVHERIDRHAERTDRNFEQVKARQDKTNGRVTRGEKRYERIVGGIVVVGLLVSAHFLHF